MGGARRLGRAVTVPLTDRWLPRVRTPCSDGEGEPPSEPDTNDTASVSCLQDIAEIAVGGSRERSGNKGRVTWEHQQPSHAAQIPPPENHRQSPYTLYICPQAIAAGHGAPCPTTGHRRGCAPCTVNPGVQHIPLAARCGHHRSPDTAHR